ncbi:MAG: hypothetical protein LPK80_12830 [Bacteroidota bacterium]|nr:hypothetical protein [Bacteroidota bacterium]
MILLFKDKGSDQGAGTEWKKNGWWNYRSWKDAGKRTPLSLQAQFPASQPDVFFFPRTGRRGRINCQTAHPNTIATATSCQVII